MNVICQHCKTKLNIPDHKIPRDKESVFKCPKCSERVIVPGMKQKTSLNGYSESSSPLSFDERLNALVCIDNMELKLKTTAIVKQMGLNTQTVEDTRAALKKLEYHIFHLLIMDDAFDQNKGVSHIIDRMNAIDMSLRRKICLVWISKKFNTNDNMAALHTSVNMIIHMNDTHELEALLSRTLMEHKNFYTVYSESLKQAGKA